MDFEQKMRQTGSLPLRERGLKSHTSPLLEESAAVAPLAGAWIEINNVHPLTSVTTAVAPLAGAWIEIQRLSEALRASLSLPLRERGLKSLCNVPGLLHLHVAPLAGAWIEITGMFRTSAWEICRSPCGSVD